MTEATAEHRDTDLVLSMLEKRIDRLADRVETLTALVGSLHADSREALALSYAACESDVRLVFVLRTVLGILEKRAGIFPEDLRFADAIARADAELRDADAQIERSVARSLAESRGQGAQ